MPILFLAGLLFSISGTYYHFGNYQQQRAFQKRIARSNTFPAPSQSVVVSGETITIMNVGYIWRLFPRAEYHISARVLHSKAYEDWQADFSPFDLALGWGVMSDPASDEWVDVRQEDRWYFFRRQKNAPLSLEEIRHSSANVHIIPATEKVRMIIGGLRQNDVVTMEGKLVDVEVDGRGERIHFQTSLTRSDTGDNSCEIFYVERVILGGEEYR